MVAISVRRLTPLLAAILSLGCSSVDVMDPEPTAIELTADRTSATTGQQVDFTFTATGTSITAVVFDFGDGQIERTDAFGATSASGHRLHAYAAGGSYTVTATVEDAITGSVSDNVTIQVTSP